MRNQTSTLEVSDVLKKIGQELPHWTYKKGHLERRYRTSGYRSSMLVANAVAHLAESANHHPVLEITYPAVVIRLQSHDSGGVTEKDFELAALIEKFITWRPQLGASALSGHPEGGHYAHVKVD
jgi:4a-hydroxytetrahydrobiopterin dehydratase